ncbi:MAG TPA: UDP-glucose 4-epimerase GalE [Thermotogota bacterium]|nr:UDP-glucose 4-epimerase GalE [Thermotogota bacterium]HRW34814.1 UDP-glucose 4-epimerase GalE [Thermotogota bacterium]
MSILVCGGAGYIGSHTVRALLESGEKVVVFDNLHKGHRDAIPKEVPFYLGDIRSKTELRELFESESIDAVIDFAADSLVGESMENPLKYYANNVSGTICLLEMMKEFKVKDIVFSSTAATYGDPQQIPIVESDPTIPKNPYGETKLTVEKLLYWSDQAYDMKYTVLRYFNAAGAHPSGEIGEDHSPETHLIPLILQVPLGKREHISVFGTDYPTKDGTCVRDYIHVSDLATAHILALKRLLSGGKSTVYNLGNGVGFSVNEVIEKARLVTNKDIPVVNTTRRAGDPAVLIASSEKITQELNWKPQYNDLEQIISSAWNWHETHPEGYAQ